MKENLSLKYFIALLFLSSALYSCAPKITQTGIASYYADKFQGKRTASGQKYRKGKRTAAHKSLPFGTRVKVTNLKNGESVKVKINDRGPFVSGRIIDLSRKAARKIDLIQSGVTKVRISYKKPKDRK